MSVLLAFVLYFQIYCYDRLLGFIGMVREAPSIWKVFAFREAENGDSISDFVKQHPPSHIEEFGVYGVYQYYSNFDRHSSPGRAVIHFVGFTVIARDGKIVGAESWGCGPVFSFFTIGDPDFQSTYLSYSKMRAAENK